jgi:hypothetical protein
VAAVPVRLWLDLDLSRVSGARGVLARAREQYELTVRGPRTEYNDVH